MSIKTTIARPYAKAAFATANQEQNIPAWTKLLQAAAWVEQQPQGQYFLQNPKFTAEKRYEWLIEVCDSVLHETGKNFLRSLAKHQRLNVLPEIAELFETYRIEQEKTIVVEVISVLPLSDLEQQDLIRALKIKLHREVVLECKLDPAIIGGLIIKADDLVIDSSVRSKLARLESELTN